MSSKIERLTWTKDGWFIADPRPSRIRSPDTSPLPRTSELNNIKVGNAVRLWFQPLLANTRGERLWVEITAIEGDRLSGKIENGPYRAPLTYGETIHFRRHHIIAIDPADYSNSSEDVKEVSRILGMFDHLRRPLNRSEEDIIKKRIHAYMMSHKRNPGDRPAPKR